MPFFSIIFNKLPNTVKSFGYITEKLDNLICNFPEINMYYMSVQLNGEHQSDRAGNLIDIYTKVHFLKCDCTYV